MVAKIHTEVIYLVIFPYLQEFALHNKFDSLKIDDEDKENVPPQPTFGGFSSRKKPGPPMPRSSSATKVWIHKLFPSQSCELTLVQSQDKMLTGIGSNSGKSPEIYLPQNNR